MRSLLLCLALAAPKVYGACPACLFTEIGGKVKQECVNNSPVASCENGKKISANSLGGASVSVDRATCLDGEWYGTSCDGSTYELVGNPAFDCGEQQRGCFCDFVDAAPVSFCANGSTHMLQCDGRISVTSSNGLTAYDSLSCTSGQWFGTGCDGTPMDLNSTFVNVQCATQDPPICPQLPSHNGLKYIGTENGLQRYSCEGNELIKLTVRDERSDGSVRSKYFECNSNFYQASSTNGDSWKFPYIQIVDFSCRDYGKINKNCSIPYHTNAFLEDGVLRCLKGFYVKSVGLFSESTGKITIIEDNQIAMTTATCEAGGWNIDGTTYTGVQLSNFKCYETPASVGTCSALIIAPNNVQHTTFTSQYNCWDAEAEQMLIVTPANIPYHGFKLQCVSGDWKFTGTSTVTIPAGSRVSCRPLKMDVLPPPFKYDIGYIDIGSIPPAPPLVPLGKTTDGLTKWSCIDSIIKIDLEYNMDIGGRMPIHASYINCNNTFYQFTSSNGNSPSFAFNQYKMLSVSCVDMGPKHSACSDPWDHGGIRKGNRYECLKGFYLRYVLWNDAGGSVRTFTADATDSKSMQCLTDGWKVEGTTLSGLSVSGFQCADANLWSSGTSCDATKIKYDYYTLNFDFFSKNAATNANEWQWSFMDGTEAEPIPLGARMSCF